MSDQMKRRETLTDDDMITSPKLSRRLLIAGAGVALGAATLGVRAAFAQKDDADEGAEILTDDGLEDTGDKGDQDKDASKNGDADKGAEILTDDGIQIED